AEEAERGATPRRAGDRRRNVHLREPPLRTSAKKGRGEQAEVAQHVPRDRDGPAEPPRVELEAIEPKPREERAETNRERGGEHARDGVLLRVLADVEQPEAGEHDPPEDDREDGSHRPSMPSRGGAVHLAFTRAPRRYVPGRGARLHVLVGEQGPVDLVRNAPATRSRTSRRLSTCRQARRTRPSSRDGTVTA